MKKRVEKPKSKPVAAKLGAVKSGETQKASPRTAASPHDPLHSLLRGTHAHKLCGPRAS
jgi:hypothetical protein